VNAYHRSVRGEAEAAWLRREPKPRSRGVINYSKLGVRDTDRYRGPGWRVSFKPVWGSRR